MGLTDRVKNIWQAYKIVNQWQNPPVPKDPFQASSMNITAEYVSMFGFGEGSEMPIATACIDILADAMASADKQIIINTGNERHPINEPETKHPLKFILDNPYSQWDEHVFWTWFYRQLFKHGNAYALIKRQGDRGRPSELVPAQSHGIQADGTRRIYTHDRGKFRYYGVVAPRNLLSLHLDDFNGNVATSPIVRASALTKLLSGCLGYNRALVEKGWHFKTALEQDVASPNITKKQKDMFMKELQKYSSGSDSAGKFLVLQKGFKAVGIDRMTSSDMQIMEILRWGMAEMCRIWRVPPRMVYQNMGTSKSAGGDVNKNVEAQGEDFYRNTLMPHLKRSEAAFSDKLLTMAEYVGNYRVVVSVDELRQGSMSERAMNANLLVTRGGILTINEGRAMIGRPPIEDGNRLINPTGTADQGIGEGKDGDKDDDDDDDKKDLNNVITMDILKDIKDPIGEMDVSI